MQNMLWSPSATPTPSHTKKNDSNTEIGGKCAFMIVLHFVKDRLHKNGNWANGGVGGHATGDGLGCWEGWAGWVGVAGGWWFGNKTMGNNEEDSASNDKFAGPWAKACQIIHLALMMIIMSQKLIIFQKLRAKSK